MPRTMRVQYQGATYHVMNRGDRQENIFVDDVDRQDFLKTLAGGCQKTGWQMHAYCLMKNHFHLVVETPNANLVDGMRWFLISEEMSRLGWKEADLVCRLKNDPGKLEM